MAMEIMDSSGKDALRLCSKSVHVGFYAKSKIKPCPAARPVELLGPLDTDQLGYFQTCFPLLKTFTDLTTAIWFVSMVVETS
jgi:hypothetical protein